jgi:hypothetical protein
VASRDFLSVRVAPAGTPVTGEICRRLGEKHPKSREPILDDLPNLKPESAVPLVERDGYWLTPIEVPFYDALRETGLFFAVQPRIQWTDRQYRLDFLVFYDGGAVAVELDGHEWHKSRAQRIQRRKKGRQKTRPHRCRSRASRWPAGGSARWTVTSDHRLAVSATRFSASSAPYMSNDQDPPDWISSIRG